MLQKAQRNSLSLRGLEKEEEERRVLERLSWQKAFQVIEKNQILNLQASRITIQ